MSTRPWVERAIVPGNKKNKVELYAYLPDEEERARAWLEQVLGSRVRLTRTRRRGVAVWKLSPEYLLRLAGAMAYAYGSAKMRLEVVHTRKCDKKCQNARVRPVWECVCRCAGEFHGGRGPRNDWYPLGRSTLVRYEKTRIDQIVIAEGQLPVGKKVPRPPQPAPERPLHRSPQQLLPPAPEPALTAPLQPRTVIPAMNRFGDLERGSTAAIPASAKTERSVPVRIPVAARKPVTRPLVAAVLVVFALGAGFWLAVPPDRPPVQQVNDQESAQPSIPREKLPPAVPPVQAPPVAQPQFPPGCFPFQPDC